MIKNIKYLISKGYTFPEIAKQLGVSRNSIASFAYRNKIKNPNYLRRITKHKHLHGKIIKYFLNHSFEETAKKFNLSKGELKSCFSSAYRNSNLLKIRKDKRRKDAWSSEELIFMLKHSGLRKREWIGRKIGRGKDIVIKERMQKLGISSKSLNGLTYSQFLSHFGVDPKLSIKTKAGPINSKCDYSYIIVPWYHINEMIKMQYIKTDEIFVKMIEIMSMFQEWIHGDDVWESIAECVNRN